MSIPSPEELGVLPGRTPGDLELDWTGVHRRLEVLKADFLRLKLPDGGFRFTCFMATSQPNCLHRVEADAATEAEAVRLALDHAEKWAGLRK